MVSLGLEDPYKITPIPIGYNLKISFMLITDQDYRIILEMIDFHTLIWQ
jgi:hypothetical protein